jgi:predicted MFS family arabinose efflux permease
MGVMMGLVVLTLAQLPASKPRDPSLPRKSVVGDLAMGFQHVRERPRLMLLVVAFVLVVMTGFSHHVLLPGFMENELGVESERMWVFLMVSAVTGLSVTIGLAGIADSRWAWPVMLLGGIILGGSLMLMSVAPSFLVACAVMLALGAGTGMFQMLNNALAMRESEQAYFGRVMALTMLAWGFNGLVGLPIGVVADHIGERHTLFIMGTAVITVVGVAAAVFASLNHREPAPVLAPALASAPEGPSGGK